MFGNFLLFIITFIIGGNRKHPPIAKDNAIGGIILKIISQ